MSLKSLLKKLIISGAGRVGLNFVHSRNKLFMVTLEGVLDRQKGTPINTVIDVGASDGHWSRKVMAYYPDVSYLLIEAQSQPYRRALEQIAKQHTKVNYVFAAAGNHEGTIHFNIDPSNTFWGQAAEKPFLENNLTVPMITVDEEVRRRRLAPPYLLKLDTHGFEVPIFEGATETLKHTNLLIVEAYNFKISEPCLRFHELCGYLEQRGFRAIALFDVVYRPSDGALCEMDLVFVPDSRPEFLINSTRK